MSVTHAYIGDIVKFDKTPDGDLLVYGKAAGPDLDLDGERCDPKWLRKAVPDWFEWGNVREQHTSIAAGVGVEIDERGDDWHIKALITDRNTAHKVETGTLKGWSLGAIGVRSYKDAQGQTWLTDGKIVEFSLVDRPCNPTTTLDIATKSASGDGDWQPVPVAGEVIAKAVKLDQEHDVADSRKAAEPGPPPPAFDRAQAIAIATAVHRKDRTGAAELALKAVGPDGRQDEAPDIAGGRAVIAQLAQLIAAEADELAAGYLGESCDITLLVQAVENVKWWLRKEEAAAGGDSDLGDAAVFIGFGAEPDVTKDAPAAPTVPAVPAEPAAKSPEPDTTKTTVSGLDTAAVQQIAEAAVMKALAPVQAENASLREELAQIKSTAIPGSPFVVAPPTAPPNEAANKAAEYRQIAANSTDPAVREAYKALALRTEAASTR